MVFSSTVFLFIFLPTVWLLYTLIPQKFIKARNTLLSVASLIFYAFGEPVYILLMIGTVLFNYFAALRMSREQGRLRKILCVITVAADIASLCFFKYVPWLVGVLNDSFSLHLLQPSYTIPVGISFYTFQILSYTVDVYTGKTEAHPSFFNLFLYISFFPQLIAGPIVKYNDIRDQLASREVTLDGTALGVRRFIFGLSKKVLISNTAALIARAAFEAASPSSLLAWSGALAYCIQLYFDFSGYSDMAIGLASMFGFKLLENFNYPYSALTIRDFWKRWHISLTSWFREYVYFPLGGNRVSKSRTIVNRLIVFFLTGLWHGANFTFILWGMWHGLLMMFEQVAKFENFAAKNLFTRILSRVYTLLAVMLGFVVFNSASVGSAFGYIGAMFSFSGNISDALIYYSPYMCVILAASVIFSLPVLPYFKSKLAGSRLCGVVECTGYIVCLPLLALSIMSLASSAFNPFIYYIF